MWRTPATLVGRLDDIPNARRRSSAVILGIETSCDDTCAAVVTPRRRDPLERHLLPGRSTTATAASCRRSPPPPPRARQRRRRRRARARPAPTLDDVELVAVTAGPGPGRRAARRRRDGQGARRARAGCRSPPVDHLQGHVAANFLGAGPVRAAVPVPRRQRRPHVPRRRATSHDGFTVARPDARRRRRRGVRQGRAAARPAVPGRPAPRALARERRPRAPSTSRSPQRRRRAWTSRSPG